MKKNFKVNEPKSVCLGDALKILSEKSLDLKFSGNVDNLESIEINSPELFYIRECKVSFFEKGLASGRIGFVVRGLKLDGCDLEKLCEYGLSCLIVSEEQYHNFKNILDNLSIPVLIYKGANEDSIRRGLTNYLQYLFAPYILLHGSAVEVFGEGVLIVGEPNIGKSECVLELVQRGHFFIADDLVKLTAFPFDTISISSGCEESQFKFFLEIRRLGIIDMLKLYGPKSIKEKGELSLVVEITNQKGEIEEKREPSRNSINFFGKEIPYLSISIGERGIMATKIEVAILEHKARKFGFRSDEVIRGVFIGKKNDKKTS